MKRTLCTLVAGWALAGAALAQPIGMGPGMMRDFGDGPGMMGGYRQGMMGGYGPGGMMGMMGGLQPDALAGLNLSIDQRKKIAEIEQEGSRSMWQLMGSMHQQGWRMQELIGGGPLDEDAARKAYQAMSDTHKAMFESQLETRRKIDAVLTKEQRDQLRKYWSTR